MFLLQCDCKCFFTLREFPTANRSWPVCPNCRKTIRIETRLSVGELVESLTNVNVSIREIPENAKITVTYDL